MSGKTEFAKDLHVLERLIKNLPDALPILPLKDSQYARLREGLDDEKIEDMGLHAAANRHLELCFPSGSHIQMDPRIPRITERGPAVEAIIPFLREYYSDHPAMRYMDKWVLDLTEGAKYIYNKHKKVRWRCHFRINL